MNSGQMSPARPSGSLEVSLLLVLPWAGAGDTGQARHGGPLCGGQEGEVGLTGGGAENFGHRAADPSTLGVLTPAP